MVWRNNDGLVVRFPLESTTPRDPRGEAPGAGYERTIDFIVDLTKTTAGQVYNEWGAKLPANSYVVAIEGTVLETITGASALTVGTQYYDGTTWVANGILTGLSGLTIGSTGTAGSQLNTVLTSPANIILTPTGQATAGKVSVRVKVLVFKADPGTVWHGA